MRWLVVIAVALVLVVAPTASSPPQDGHTAGEPRAATEPAAGTEPAAAAEAPAPVDPEATAKELKEFVPSEEITADSAVSFPVDI